MSSSVEDKLELSREATDRHAWDEARRLLEEADAEDPLDADGLRQLGKIYYWCRDVRRAVDTFERAYAAFVSKGSRRKAAAVALMLRYNCGTLLRDPAAARGWVQRAEHLLEQEAECVEVGFLWRVQGNGAFISGDTESGRRLLKNAIDLGRRLGDANLVAMSMTLLGANLAETGHADEAYPYLDEACTAALGGELGPWATGIVYCNAIGAYRGAGEFAMAGEWTHTAGRWCERESITGFAGICQVHRAEFMRLRGAWAEAEREARLAAGGWDGASPVWLGEAQYEIGEIRLRMGDLDGADTAFREAHALGRDPQPGVALVLAARGKAAAAMRSIETSAPAGMLEETRCVAAKVDLACAIGDVSTASAAAERAESIAAANCGLGLQVLAAQARGTVQLAQEDAGALPTLRRALNMWQQVDAPYEAARVRLLVARSLRLSGDEVGARRECEAAISTFERLGAGPDAAAAKRLLEEPDVEAIVAQRTLLFSDIVGSTQLVEAIGDQAWNDLVAWLDGALRQCFTIHHGEEVDHAGDGFFVAFPDSKSAVECAIAMQRMLAEHRRSHGFAPRIRIGVHATSASQSGGRYRGRGVHEASRIVSLAGPDEILASRATVPDGFAVAESREVQVKGISKTLEVLRIDWTR